MDKAMTRREFLLRGASLIAACATIPQFLTRTALALTPSPGSGVAPPTDAPILVVIQLGGGNDGLNTVIPWADDAYYRARPGLAVPRSNVLRLTDELGLHPALAPLKNHWEKGDMAIVLGVGYPNPNRSHFRSMEIWQTARPDSSKESAGWIGRYFDNECAGCAEPTAGVSIGETLPLALRSQRGVGVSLSEPAAFARAASRASLGEMADRSLGESLRKLLDPGNGASALDFLRRTALNTHVAEEQIAAALARYQGRVEYPDSALGHRLHLIARLIGGRLPTRVYYVDHTGFDTHANQAGRHEELLAQLAAALAAFLQEMAAQGNRERVLVMTFSEFGRRVQENASGGTDHGTAAPMFLLGGGVKAGLYGKQPSLTDLDRGDLKYQTDFRSVYATVLARWLQGNPAAILGSSFPLLPVLG